MKDDNDFRSLSVGQTAREFIDQYGREADRILHDRAALARESDDVVSAEIWEEIADKVKQLAEPA